MTLRNWSFGRLALVSLLWAVGVILFMGLRIFTFMRAEAAHSGIVGFSAGLDDLLNLAGCVLLPPIALFTAWVLQRR